MTANDRLQRAFELTCPPEGAMPTEAVVVAGYIDADGDAMVTITTLGDAAVTTYVGCLAWAQHNLLHRNHEDNEP